MGTHKYLYVKDASGEWVLENDRYYVTNNTSLRREREAKLSETYGSEGWQIRNDPTDLNKYYVNGMEVSYYEYTQAQAARNKAALTPTPIVSRDTISGVTRYEEQKKVAEIAEERGVSPSTVVWTGDVPYTDVARQIKAESAYNTAVRTMEMEKYIYDYDQAAAKRLALSPATERPIKSGTMVEAWTPRIPMAYSPSPAALAGLPGAEYKVTLAPKSSLIPAKKTLPPSAYGITKPTYSQLPTSTTQKQTEDLLLGYQAINKVQEQKWAGYVVAVKTAIRPSFFGKPIAAPENRVWYSPIKAGQEILEGMLMTPKLVANDLKTFGYKGYMTYKAMQLPQAKSTLSMEYKRAFVTTGKEVYTRPSTYIMAAGGAFLGGKAAVAKRRSALTETHLSKSFTDRYYPESKPGVFLDMTQTKAHISYANAKWRALPLKEATPKELLGFDVRGKAYEFSREKGGGYVSQIEAGWRIQKQVKGGKYQDVALAKVRGVGETRFDYGGSVKQSELMVNIAEVAKKSKNVPAKEILLRLVQETKMTSPNKMVSTEYLFEQTRAAKVGQKTTKSILGTGDYIKLQQKMGNVGRVGGTYPTRTGAMSQFFMETNYPRTTNILRGVGLRGIPEQFAARNARLASELQFKGFPVKETMSYTKAPAEYSLLRMGSSRSGKLWEIDKAGWGMEQRWATVGEATKAELPWGVRITPEEFGVSRQTATIKKMLGSKKGTGGGRPRQMLEPLELEFDGQGQPMQSLWNSKTTGDLLTKVIKEVEGGKFATTQRLRIAGAVGAGTIIGTSSISATRPSAFQQDMTMFDIAAEQRQTSRVQPMQILKPLMETKTITQPKVISNIKPIELVRPIQSTRAVTQTKAIQTTRAIQNVKPFQEVKPIQIQEIIQEVKPIQDIKQVTNIRVTHDFPPIYNIGGGGSGGGGFWWDNRGAMAGLMPKGRKMPKGVSTSYTPSFKAWDLGIVAPKGFDPKKFLGTGLGVRPLVRRSRKK